MDDTQFLDGHGESTMAELAELRKALEIGYTSPVSGQDVLRVESLESTLKVMTHEARHARFWNLIPKTGASSTIEEFNRLASLGSDNGGFVSGGDLPDEEDSTYQRDSEKVKYLGTTRSVKHPATLVNTVPANLIGQETQNGALWLIGKLNYGLYYAEEAVNPLEFNSVPSQIQADAAATNVIDCAGQPLSTANLEDAAEIITTAFGMPSVMLAATPVLSDFSNTYGQYQRFARTPGGPIAAGYVGTPVKGYSSAHGDIPFEPDVFIKQSKSPPSAATHAKAPNTPSIAITDDGATTGSKFVTADAGTYQYQVTAVNQYGESAPTALGASWTPDAGDGATLTITDGGGTYGATGYRIYRTAKGGTATSFLYQTARATSGGAYQPTTDYAEINEWRSFCSIGLVLDFSEQSLRFKQLSPMVKMPLATISPAIRWMQLLYGTPIVYNATRNVLFKNIGRA